MVTGEDVLEVLGVGYEVSTPTWISGEQKYAGANGVSRILLYACFFVSEAGRLWLPQLRGHLASCPSGVPPLGRPSLGLRRHLRAVLVWGGRHGGRVPTSRGRAGSLVAGSGTPHAWQSTIQKAENRG